MDDEQSIDTVYDHLEQKVEQYIVREMIEQVYQIDTVQEQNLQLILHVQQT